MQLLEQVRVLGRPSKETMSKISSEMPQTSFDHIAKLDNHQPQKLLSLLPCKDYPKKDMEEAADLLAKMVKWVPSERISCQEALKHPFFKGVKV